MHKTLYILIGILFSLQSYSQLETSRVRFNVSTQDSNIILENLRFYVGHIHFKQDGRLVHSDSSYYLVDLNESEPEFHFKLPASSEYNLIEFSLGTDSTTNDSGYLEGDLDPLHGMYWTWQSGYINFKLEANVQGQKIEHHLGGFLHPNATIQKLQFETNSKEISIEFQADKYISEVLKSKEFRLMSPGPNAVKYSQAAASFFKLHTNDE